MSRQLEYIYKGQTKSMSFSFRQFHSAHEAAAFSEGIDITDFLKMERHLEELAEPSAVKNHRQAYFNSLGFEKIYLIKNKKEPKTPQK